MFSKCGAASAFILFLFLCTGMRAMAQPTLPDIAASADKGVVVLSWNCQYSGVKLIAVMRSADSNSNYATIGNVKNLDKGLQAFVDGHPAAGKNYYQLAIVFKSGLSWRSNHCSIVVDKSLLESDRKLPANDSLQHFTVTEELSAAGKSNNKNTKQATANAQQAPATQDPIKHKIAVSFDTPPVQPDVKNTTVNDTARSAPVKHKVVISFGAPEDNLTINIKSKYIFIDAPTGHVNMQLPADVNKITYSVKFFDDQNRMAFEVPKIKAPRILIDRRNFQHKGTYKFVLRKDGIELETGYVVIK